MLASAHDPTSRLLGSLLVCGGTSSRGSRASRSPVAGLRAGQGVIDGGVHWRGSILHRHGAARHDDRRCGSRGTRRASERRGVCRCETRQPRIPSRNTEWPSSGALLPRCRNARSASRTFVRSNPGGPAASGSTARFSGQRFLDGCTRRVDVPVRRALDRPLRNTTRLLHLAPAQME